MKGQWDPNKIGRIFAEAMGQGLGQGWQGDATFGCNPFGGGGSGRGGFTFGGSFMGGRGGGHPFRKGSRVRKGDVRAAALALLAEQPRNGYQIIQEINQRSRGLWKPSSGAIYPALQQLEDEGLVRSVEAEGRKVYALTDSGRSYVKEHPEEVNAPWDAVNESVDEGMMDLHAMLGQVAQAVTQVGYSGTPRQVAKARQVLMDSRRALYQILGDGDVEEEA